MKTSSKLLLTALVIILITILSILIWLRTNINEYTITPSGKEVTNSIVLEKFNSLNISGNFEVTIINDSSYKANYSVDENFLEYIEFENIDNTLYIKIKKGLGLKKNIKLELSVGSLSKIVLSAGASVIKSQKIIEENLELNLSSGSFLKLEIDVSSLSSNISSGSELILLGKAENTSFNISSGSDLDANELITENATINTSSGSDAKINVNNTLNATASSGSSIYYKGEASVVSSNISSGGELKKH